MITAHLTEFGGYRVQPWEPGQPLGDPVTTIHRISNEWDGTSWVEQFRQFLELPGVQDTPGLVVGEWGEEVAAGTTPEAAIEALVAAHAQLPNLRVLFFGDMTYEECEISWIQNGDLSPLLDAYPHLTHLGIRGGSGLGLGRVNLPELRYLIIQSSGLDARVVREVMNAELPALEHLELYLGDSGYGGDSTPQDITPLLDGTLFPNLKYLGLKNSQFQDDLAQMLANAPVLDGLHTLDLSLGEFSDDGLRALLSSAKVEGLRVVQLRHARPAYTLNLLAELKSKLEPHGVQVDAARENNPGESWRYVSLSE